MKFKRFLLVLIVIFFANITFLYAQGVGISMTGATPDNSAILDVSSNSKGILLPRMTTTERNLIPSPANTLMIFNTEDNCFQTYVSGSWQNIKCFGCNPYIDFHPADSSLCAGEDASFSVNASGANLSFQWQENNGGGFANLANGGVYSGVTTATLNITGAGAGLDGYTYRVIVSGDCSPSVTSNTATLNITSSALAITAHPTDQSFNNGDTINLSVIAADVTNYQWQESTNGGSSWTNIANGGSNPTYTGATSSSLALQNADSAALDSNLYRVIISNTCESITSDSALVSFFTCPSSLTDARDGKSYNVVKIGSQCWMAENLDFNASGSNDWCYDNNASNCTTYGRLYFWTTAMSGSGSSNSNPSGVQGVCPSGWHLPSDAEWTELETYLGGTSVAGGKMKETGTTHWNSPNSGATNSSGFTALPGGHSDSGGPAFYNLGKYGYWWTATEQNASLAWYRYIGNSGGSISRSAVNKGNTGFSVRCVRD